jgi:hypothetical protein
MLRLALSEHGDVDYLNVVAAMVREVPQVWRVRVVLDARQLEILHRHPSPGLLQAVHQAVLAAGPEMVALRTR